MLGRRAVACLLTILVLLLGASFHVAPYSAGMDHGTELAVTQGMPGAAENVTAATFPQPLRAKSIAWVLPQRS